MSDYQSDKRKNSLTPGCSRPSDGWDISEELIFYIVVQTAKELPSWVNQHLIN